MMPLRLCGARLALVVTLGFFSLRTWDRMRCMVHCMGYIFRGLVAWCIAWLVTPGNARRCSKTRHASLHAATCACARTMAQPFGIRSTPELGRHLVASRSISAGQLVVAQKPWAAVLYDEQVPLRCDYCFRPAVQGMTLLRCSRSRHARYCSREHQLAAWSATYKHECRALVAHAPRIPPPTIRLAARALWASLSAPPQHQQEDWCSWHAVQSLLSHWELLDDDKKVMFAQMAVLAREFTEAGMDAKGASGTDTLPGVQDIAHLLARMACNNHTICDEDLRPIGVGLYPLGAMLNHSCSPNCMQSFGPCGRIEFRALVNIAPGEPLTISYVELAATRQERREELAATYRFDIATPAPAALPPLPPSGAQAGARAMDLDAAPSGRAGEPVASSCEAAAPGSGGPTSSSARFSRAVLRGEPPLGELEFSVAEALPSHSQLTGVRQGNTAGTLQSQSATVGTPGCLDSLPGRLRVYQGRSEDGLGGLPPWPVDGRDERLTEVVVAQSSPSARATSGMSGGSRGSGSLAGGLQARLVVGALGNSGSYDIEEGEGATEEPSASEGQGPKTVVEVDCWGGWATQALASGALKAGLVGEAHAGLPGIDEGDEEMAAEPTWQAVGGGAQPLVSLVKRVGRALVLQDAADQQARQGQYAGALSHLREALVLVEPGGGGTSTAGSGDDAQLGLGPCHLLRMRLNAALLKTAIDEGSSWDVALAAAEELTPVYQLAYPAIWPNLGLHYATLSKLELLHDRFQAAAEHARMALVILQRTHSTSSGLGSAGPSVLDQVQLSLQEAEAYIRGHQGQGSKD